MERIAERKLLLAEIRYSNLILKLGKAIEDPYCCRFDDDGYDQRDTDAQIIALPTEEREREKRRVRIAKEAGIPLRQNKRQSKVIEQQFDDCGSDLTPLICFIRDAGYDEDMDNDFVEDHSAEHFADDACVSAGYETCYVSSSWRASAFSSATHRGGLH